MADKLLIRVLGAVESGLTTSTAIAAHLQANPATVSWMLGELMRCGEVTRERCAVTRRGRPSYIYRIVVRTTVFVGRQPLAS